MMKYLFCVLFLIPLSFSSNFWMIFFYLLLMSFIFMLSLISGSFFCEISVFFGCDNLSYWMVLLSLWICALMVKASGLIWSFKFYYHFFLLVNLILLVSLILAFCTLNFFIFYLFFEVSIIPTLFLILGWGYQPERLQAGIYMFFYTLVASLPMMIALFFLFGNFNSLDYSYFLTFNSAYLYLCMNLVFFVKIPMFFIHLWLPKAHVEAPISGSMILAGVMLKLGGYGLMRVLMIFLGLKYLNLIFLVIGLVGGCYVSLVCLRQVDIKALIAYSSVAHMGMVLSGLMGGNMWGFYGSLVMMVAHGLCSSGLFCLSNICYERFLSRSMFLVKGLVNLMPSFSLWWFLLSAGNMAAPPSLNLFGEIMLINSIMSYSFMSVVFLGILSFFSACYCLYLYSFTQHGNLGSGVHSFSLGSIREYSLLLLHGIPLNIIFMMLNLFI
uniref:NADH-ubiquinone oxidoreductase chain 4 n=1 Tax=Elateroidea sp. BMNH 1274729 TaxID=1796501 RepID=A0A126TEJ9_9COLE|nr:NADH dehydrogenase subunit 4 [Elateroidea sp. BMNH 1274729]